MQNSEQEIGPESTVDIDQEAQWIIAETLADLAKEVAQKRKGSSKKQEKNKGKAII